MRWTRRRALLGAFTAVVLGASGVTPLAGALDPVTDGVDTRVVLPSGRAMVLHVPPELRRSPRAGAGRPAMVVLHGLRSNPSDTVAATAFDELADRDGVLVAYPEGVRRSFNAGTCCGEAVPARVDDVGFLAEVVAALRARGADRVSVVGFSNGGMMAYRFACERPDLVDTVGVLAGSLQIPRCDGPVRALHLHGELDDVVPYAGRDFDPRLRTFLRAVGTIPEAARGSALTIRRVPGLPHRWPEQGDPVDAVAEFWAFARMGERPAGS